MAGVHGLLLGGAAPVQVAITPATFSDSSGSAVGNHVFAATASAPVDSYAWGVDAGGTPGSGSLGFGGATANCSLRCEDFAQGDFAACTAFFYCDMTIGGVTYRATCQYDHQWI